MDFFFHHRIFLSTHIHFGASIFHTLFYSTTISSTIKHISGCIFSRFSICHRRNKLPFHIPSNHYSGCRCHAYNHRISCLFSMLFLLFFFVHSDALLLFMFFIFFCYYSNDLYVFEKPLIMAIWIFFFFPWAISYFILHKSMTEAQAHNFTKYKIDFPPVYCCIFYIKKNNIVSNSRFEVNLIIYFCHLLCYFLL